MDISIIIPVFNGEETLKLCLDSIKALTIPDGMNIEVLLINDGSTDRTREIALTYAGVTVIDLEKNMGRIVARKTGAEKAKYEDLLFVDARVEVRFDALIKITEIDYSPIMAGDISEEKYRTNYDALFYLIRKKIYYPYYPQKNYGEKLWIERHNFHKAPKGTTCIFVKKSIFINSTPIDERKDTSDDTKLLKNIVFKEGINILRDTNLSIKYNQRTGSGIYSWIHHRGRIWADYYLSFLNKYSIAYTILTALLIWFITSEPLMVIIIFALVICFSALYISENIKDFFLVIKLLPLLMMRFYLGTLEKLFIKSARKFW